MKPAFTIGIPTFNRAELLDALIPRVLAQSFNEFELLISDNASTDRTEIVVRKYSDPRIKYIRQHQNIGPTANFRAIVESAVGDWVVFHQDDDFLSKHFLARCHRAVSTFPSSVMYLASTLGSESSSVFSRPSVFSPPIPLDWMGDGSPKAVKGAIFAPLALFMSAGIPPAAAFRCDAIRRSSVAWASDCLLFNERLLLAEVAAHGEVIVDPWFGGVFITHPTQQSAVHWEEYKPQWRIMAERLDVLASQHDLRWVDALKRLLAELPVSIVKEWFHASQNWPGDLPFCSDVRDAIANSRKFADLEMAKIEISGAACDTPRSFKRILRSLTPPLLWDSMAKLKRVFQ